MKKITLGVFVFSIIAFLGFGIVAAFPFDLGKGFMSHELGETEQTELQVFHDSLMEAIENEDFESWKSLMESQLTEEKFQEIIENQKLMEEKRAESEEEREKFCEENDCPDFEEGNFEFKGGPRMMRDFGNPSEECPSEE